MNCLMILCPRYIPTVRLSLFDGDDDVDGYSDTAERLTDTATVVRARYAFIEFAATLRL